MKMKKIAVVLLSMSLAVGVVGCSSTASLPEGEVKIVNQEIQGIVELLLEASDYGNDKSTVVSMVLSEDSQYDINLYMEKYLGGELLETKEIANYTTGTISKDSIIHMVLNTAKVNDGETEKSIFSIAEIDSESTTDSSNPEYNVTKYYEDAFDYDSKSQISQLGTDLDKDITLVALVKFNEDDSEKAPINLDTYEDEVKNYSEATVIKARVLKK